MHSYTPEDNSTYLFVVTVEEAACKAGEIGFVEEGFCELVGDGGFIGCHFLIWLRCFFDDDVLDLVSRIGLARKIGRGKRRVEGERREARRDGRGKVGEKKRKWLEGRVR